MTMNRRSALQLIGSTVLGSITIGTAAAHDGGQTGDTQAQDDIATVRRATAKYQDPERAKADGYMPVHGCIATSNGGMGVHFVNPSLRGDGEVNATEPEVLLYEPTDGGYNLVGVEYIANTADVDSRPSLFGQPFVGPMPAHGDHGEEHYELHVWCWKANPKGMFAPFNPTVDCE